jgi:putative FmdB family regulatory protein
MPTYEYRCRACGHELEAVQSFNDDPLTDCPECGGSLRKVFGSIGVTFKGSGFYKNDHGSRAKSGSSASGSTGSESSSSGSSDSSSTPAAASTPSSTTTTSSSAD